MENLIQVTKPVDGNFRIFYLLGDRTPISSCFLRDHQICPSLSALMASSLTEAEVRRQLAALGYTDLPEVVFKDFMEGIVV